MEARQLLLLVLHRTAVALHHRTAARPQQLVVAMAHLSPTTALRHRSHHRAHRAHRATDHRPLRVTQRLDQLSAVGMCLKQRLASSAGRRRRMAMPVRAMCLLLHTAMLVIRPINPQCSREAAMQATPPMPARRDAQTRVMEEVRPSTEQQQGVTVRTQGRHISQWRRQQQQQEG